MSSNLKSLTQINRAWTALQFPPEHNTVHQTTREKADPRSNSTTKEWTHVPPNMLEISFRTAQLLDGDCTTECAPSCRTVVGGLTLTQSTSQLLLPHLPLTWHQKNKGAQVKPAPNNVKCGFGDCCWRHAPNVTAKPAFPLQIGPCQKRMQIQTGAQPGKEQSAKVFGILRILLAPTKIPLFY